MSDAIISILRAIAAGSGSYNDPANYAIWVHSVVTEALNDVEQTMQPVADETAGLDHDLVALIEGILYGCFNPFGVDGLTDPDADQAFRSHLRRAAAAIIHQAYPSQSPTVEMAWKDISTAPQDGTAVVLLNATNGDQAIARYMPVKDEEPVWIFAQGYTAENTQVSFRFENPTHWQDVDQNIPYIATVQATEPVYDYAQQDVYVPPVADVPQEVPVVDDHAVGELVDPTMPIQPEEIIQLPPEDPQP